MVSLLFISERLPDKDVTGDGPDGKEFALDPGAATSTPLAALDAYFC